MTQVHLLTIVDQANFDVRLHQSIWHKNDDAEAFALRFRAARVAADPDWYQSYDKQGRGIAYTIIAYDVREAEIMAESTEATLARYAAGRN